MPSTVPPKTPEREDAREEQPAPPGVGQRNVEREARDEEQQHDLDERGAHDETDLREVGTGGIAWRVAA